LLGGGCCGIAFALSLFACGFQKFSDFSSDCKEKEETSSSC